jgi:hypothetical protein
MEPPPPQTSDHLNADIPGRWLGARLTLTILAFFGLHGHLT